MNIDPRVLPSLSEVTRRDVIDYLLLMQPPFSGRLDLVTFLERVWPLKSMPSTDSRYKTAAGDIWKHMIDNNDWTYEYLFFDYLDVLHCDVAVFLKLIEAVVHPAVKSDEPSARKSVLALNDILKGDGYQLTVTKYISGKPIHEAILRDPASTSNGNEPYDVVLSYAGEQRQYVAEVAEFLKQRGVNVFFDRDVEAELWGKDLVEYLDQIFRGNARYCVMFISKQYMDKAWPTHERQSALAKAITQRHEYILPARFDDVDVPGLQPTIKYVDLRSKLPSEIGSLILQKLGR